MKTTMALKLMPRLTQEALSLQQSLCLLLIKLSRQLQSLPLVTSVWFGMPRLTLRQQFGTVLSPRPGVTSSYRRQMALQSCRQMASR